LVESAGEHLALLQSDRTDDPVQRALRESLPREQWSRVADDSRQRLTPVAQ
jgi:hypothetical protein